MTLERLREILGGFGASRIAILGDFFLDRYLDIDPGLTELSLETGLTAYQVTGVRCSPGAAGTVANNLSALGVGTIYALGYVGDDGQGYELRRELAARRVGLDHLAVRQDLMTPTYTKPLLHHPEGPPEELNRLDIRNRRPLPEDLQEAILTSLVEVVRGVDGVIIADQVEERDFGVVTDRVRAAVAELALEYPEVVFVADSRARIGEFRSVILKPNQHEALAAVSRPAERPSQEDVEAAARELSERSGRPALVTLGPRGVLVCDRASCTLVPGAPVSGPIDIVGAGDSVLAGITASLCAGATLEEAAVAGNLVASITVQQIGTTGTATPEQVMARLAEVAA